MTERYIGSRLFLSCDLVGSTALKQPGQRAWIPHFLQFYRGFPARVSSKIASKHPENVDPEKLTLWKPIGDELIFTYDVVGADQVRDLVRLWVEAMDDYDADLVKAGLSTKGSAFLATFPLPDREVAIPMATTSAQVADEDNEALNELAVMNREPGFVYDYLGPSVDTGFRVAALSTARHFTLTLEVAWAFAVAERSRQTQATKDFALLGAHRLRGVWHGREYPVFALDRFAGRDDNVALALNKLSGVQIPDLKQVVELAEACHLDPKWPCKVHLPETTGYHLFSAQQDALEAAANKLNEFAGQRMDPDDLRNDPGDKTLIEEVPYT